MLDRTEIDLLADRSSPEIDDASTPTPDDVRAALNRIVTSAEFVSSPHLAAFLTYSVETTLAGESSHIKAYSVATSVLGRPPTFDPQADPIVRVEATRLRRALERYYLHDGADDPVLIDIPRGRYIAFFSYRRSTALPSAKALTDAAHDPVAGVANDNHIMEMREDTRHYWLNFSTSERRSIAVLAFGLMGAAVTWGILPIGQAPQKPIEQAFILQPASNLSQGNKGEFTTGAFSAPDGAHQRVIFASLQLNPFDSYSDHPEHSGHSDHSDHHDLSHRLTHLIAERAPDFEGIPVIDPDGPMAVDPIDDHLYALMGTILQEPEHPDRIEISVRLVERPSYEIIWTKSYRIEDGLSLFDEKLLAIRDDIVNSIAGLNGAIRVDDARRHVDEKLGSNPVQICLSGSDLALRTRDPAQVAKAITCLTAILDKRPNEALIHKQLAALRMLDHQTPLERGASMISAKHDLETALLLAPADRDARQKLDALR